MCCHCRTEINLYSCEICFRFGSLKQTLYLFVYTTIQAKLTSSRGKKTGLEAKDSSFVVGVVVLASAGVADEVGGGMEIDPARCLGIVRFAGHTGLLAAQQIGVGARMVVQRGNPCSSCCP